MRDFRLPPRCELYLRSFGTLRSVELQLLTDVSVHPRHPILKCQAVQEDCMILGRPMGCPETSVRNYHSTLRKITKQRRHT